MSLLRKHEGCEVTESVNTLIENCTASASPTKNKQKSGCVFKTHQYFMLDREPDTLAVRF